eukprot:m.88634 g.88634  ORF g.88634 m.88634 type:complete len:642 (-) comp14950_c0_seq1:120-2045(-)
MATTIPFLRLTWQNLVYTVTDRTTGDDRVVLNSISGYAESSKLLCCMGSSGAGKTSLLNTLAGRLKSGRIEGNVLLNGEPIDHEHMANVSAYITQDDVLMITQTPRELLTFSARLRLPKTKTPEEIAQTVDAILTQLALDRVADSLVGSPATGGLSGGERKRVSIGIELVTNPWMLFVDEPTSGLDSYTAASVMQLLGQLAGEGRLVVCTIHQPSSEIFASFENLMLLHQGGVAYFGKAGQVLDYYSTELELPCPQHFNPAEHVVNALMAQLRGEGKTDTNFPDKFKASALYEASKAPGNAMALTLPEPPAQSTRRGFFGEVGVLVARSWKNYVRGKTGLRARFGQTLFFAIFTSLVFANLEEDVAGVQDRQGLLFFITVNQAITSLMSAVTTFPVERQLMQREEATGTYRPGSYFFAKSLAEDPFNVIMPLLFTTIVYFATGLRDGADHFFIAWAALMLVAFSMQSVGLFVGTIAPNVEIAIVLTPMFIIPFFLTGGLFANRDRLDPYWLWIERISPIAYGNEILSRNEYADRNLTADYTATGADDPNLDFLDGNNIIDRLNFSLSISTCFWALVGLTFAFRLIAFGMLKFRLRSDDADDELNADFIAAKRSARSSQRFSKRRNDAADHAIPLERVEATV